MKKSKKLILTSSCLAVAALSSQSAFADWKFRFGPTNINYEADVSYSNRNVSGTTSYTNASNIGLTYVRESGMYIDFGATGGKHRTDPRDSTKSLGRTDLTLVLGQADVGETGIARSMYFGYKTGWTQVTMPLLYLSSVEEFRFATRGFVLGGGLGFPLDIGGTVGVNAGLGLMNMDMTNSTDWSAGYIHSENALGYSVGVNYVYPFTKAVGVTLEYKGNMYSYKFNGVLPAPTTVKENWTVAGIIFYANF